MPVTCPSQRQTERGKPTLKSSTEVTVSGHEGDQSRQGEVSPKRAVVEAALVDGHRRIFGFLLGRLRNADEAKDVMQEFALRAIRRAEELRDVQSVRGWLSRLLATAISDHHRRFNRRRNLELPAGETVEDPDLAAGPDAETDAAVCKCLRELIGLLPSGPSDLLRRIDLDQQSRPDVASALNITEATLAVRLHRARAKLRELLVKMCLTCPEHGFFDCACDRARRLRQASGRPIQ